MITVTEGLMLVAAALALYIPYSFYDVVLRKGKRDENK
jgi:hypothetical protein